MRVDLGDRFMRFADNTADFDAVSKDLDRRLVVDLDAPPGPEISVPDALDGDERRLAITVAALKLAQATPARSVANSQLTKTELLATGILALYHDLKDHQKVLSAYRQNMPDLAQLTAEVRGLEQRLASAEADAAEKTAALRAVDRETSVKRTERLVDEARAQERDRVAAEMSALAGENARQKSEIDELRASKKKLREALDRKKEGR